jgi:asparagine synthase (glutamine-hydrolysing)
MCGIVSIFSRQHQVQEASLMRALNALRHRGPDEQRCWVDPNSRVGLGHARLSIIDPATGSQPMVSEDGQIHIVVSGEFYDFERIRSDLETRGHHFRSRSDSEILIHLYEEMGTSCIEHLRGEFAFVLWDEGSRQLFAARDRFGIKPLFYAWYRDTLYLASEAKGLFAAGVPGSWDHESVYQNLFFCLGQERSLFKNVRQIPAGHYLIADRRTTTLKCYWDIEYPLEKGLDNRLSESECISQVQDLLNESVRLRMRADVPVGCFLSGGLDSSSVLQLASKESREPLVAFTVAFNQSDHDESRQAALAASHAGARFKPLPVSEPDFVDCFRETVWHGEMIEYNVHGTARFLLSRAVRDAGYKVVLAGEGADELFAGYDFCSAALQGQGQSELGHYLSLLFRFIRPQTHSERRVRSISPWLARRIRLLGFPPQLIDTMAQKANQLRSLLDSDFRSSFEDFDPYREFFDSLDYKGKIKGREPVKQVLYLWVKSLFVNYVLAAERLDMAHSVEVRLPFLDHQLFEYASLLPASLLTENGTSKSILRKAMRTYLPKSICDRPKHAFWGPASTHSEGNQLHAFTQDILRSRLAGSIPFFDQHNVIRLLDGMADLDGPSRASLDPVLLMLVSMCLLHEQFDL